MYEPTLAHILSTALVLLPLLASGAPASSPAKQAAPTGPGNQFLGRLTWYSQQQPDLVLASISNNSTAHYAILTKNNLFDDSHPYRPLLAASLSRAPITLLGSRYPYPTIEDAQFRDFPPGSVWERYFNMSQYLPPVADARAPESRCFSFQLPRTVEALAIDDNKTGQHLADIFLSQGLTNVELVSNPLHMNVTVTPSGGTRTNAAAGAAQSIPAQSAGVFLLPNEQTGHVVNTFQNVQPISEQEGFVIGAGSSSEVQPNSEEIDI
ncbi:MAG: hypothetical protein Q9209_001516 [Squamulea sp. 1 TL-2023]